MQDKHEKDIFRFLLVIISAGILFHGCLGNSGISSGVKVTNYVMGRAFLSGQDGIDSEDIANLEAGHLHKLKTKYETVGKENLTNSQLSLLCDVYTKFNDFSATMNCLNSLESRSSGEKETTDMLLGRRAVAYLQAGQFNKASQLSQAIKSDAGQYVYALAQAYLGKNAVPRKVAQRFSQYADNRRIYFATAIYMAMADYKNALSLLTQPQTRLLKDYGLLPHTNALGQTIHPAVFQMDLFGEFNFGFFKAFSFAPKANVYVEFMAARSYAATGVTDQALKRLSYLVDSLDGGLFRDVLWMSYFERGKIYEAQGEVEKAIEDYQQAIKLIEGIRSNIRSEMGRVGFSANKFSVYNRLIELLIRTHDLETALEVVERSKGRSLVDMLSARSSFGVSRSEDFHDAPVLLDQLAEAEANLLTGSPEQSTSELNSRLREIERLWEELRTKAPSLASLVTVPSVSIQKLRQRIRDDEVVLIFHQISNRLYRFALTKETLLEHDESIDGLFEEIQGFRDAIADIMTEEYRPYAARLYTRLLGTLKIEGKKRLTIIPSGTLYYLPFSALMTPSGQWLVTRQVVRFLPNLSILPLLNKREQITKKDAILIFANPTRKELDDLPGAEIEASEIAEMMTSSKVLLRQEASLQNFKKMCGGYPFIHIASHGVFDSVHPLESRLLLAPDIGKDNGDLKVSDLYGLRLSSHMVVLSACETGLSHISPGDELIGLQRGFLYAGANGMIGSLWSIADESTNFIMTRLYHYLHKGGVPPDTALKMAQAEGLEEYKHPFFWAPFTYTGLLY